MRDYRRPAAVWVIAALIVAFALSVIPTPYLLLGPGRAVDLGPRVVVGARATSHRHYFLTDVTITRASVLLLALRFVPGERLVRSDTLVPAGETHAEYDRLLLAAMSESQTLAALVAERAAGYRVADPPRRIFVERVLPASRAGSALQDGDALLRVQGRRIVALGDVSNVIAALPAGDDARVELERGGRLVQALIPTIATPDGSRLGILVRTSTQQPVLPVPVRFDLGDIAGSSGGLMFALQIYADLVGDARVRPHAIAGTGTIAPDGSVGRIEGLQQKLIAAQRAGVDIFLVPRENARDVANFSGLRIVPVGTFREAVNAIGGYVNKRIADHHNREAHRGSPSTSS